MLREIGKFTNILVVQPVDQERKFYYDWPEYSIYNKSLSNICLLRDKTKNKNYNVNKMFITLSNILVQWKGKLIL